MSTINYEAYPHISREHLDRAILSAYQLDNFKARGHRHAQYSQDLLRRIQHIKDTFPYPSELELPLARQPMVTRSTTPSFTEPEFPLDWATNKPVFEAAIKDFNQYMDQGRIILGDHSTPITPTPNIPQNFSQSGIPNTLTPVHTTPENNTNQVMLQQISIMMVTTMSAAIDRIFDRIN